MGVGMFKYPVPRGRYAHGSSGYAVIDLETTGFDPGRADRIVEVAIVRISPVGRELGTYQTLVNPGRSTGASAVHGISDEMVADAPGFPEIATSVLAWLQGVVVVAHNAPFEDAFLSAEFARAGLWVPGLPALDTLPLAQRWIPTPDHKLPTVCSWAGVTIEGAHTAVGDARATARMLPALLTASRAPRRWREPLPHLAGSMGGRYLPRVSLPDSGTLPGSTLEVAG